jgi:transposase-like protein
VQVFGYGSLAAVARATGIAPSTLRRGLKDLEHGTGRSERLRRPGGGRKRLADTDAKLESDLLNLVEPMTLGCPERPLLWVSKSAEKLAAALRDLGHKVSAKTVRRLLHHLGFRRQGNHKVNDGRGHPDWDAQFEHINACALEFQAADQPVISVDTKLDFADSGRLWGSSIDPEEALCSDELQRLIERQDDGSKV